VEAAKKKLKHAKGSVEDDDTYVYLPPGCSVADPVYNSGIDGDQRVVKMDPAPETEK
jgi:hypothetical protein